MDITKVSPDRRLRYDPGGMNHGYSAFRRDEVKEDIAADPTGPAGCSSEWVSSLYSGKREAKVGNEQQVVDDGGIIVVNEQEKVREAILTDCAEHCIVGSVDNSAAEGFGTGL